MPIYQHFRKNEHPFVDRAIDWMNNVRDQYTVYVTDFLNPREREIVTSVIGLNNEEVKFSFFGGVDDAERERAVIAPYFVDIDEADFELIGLEATYAQKFVTLEHPDVLGAFTSLGIDRKMIGDIFVHDGRIQLITTEEFKHYVMQELTEIKRTKVSFKEVALQDIEKDEQNWQRKHHTVSSMRLDVVVKAVYQLSRKNATKLIESERVSLNYALESNPATLLGPGDLLSVRGYGRCKLIADEGRTRKDKHRLIAARLM
ncbi:MAG TPA: YlmH/Sll1252 family protein [Pseudogracilibacillus sp.]|nr:YlmH/Sll1252 family protein [Pseudogracilibacillus sp.]